MTRILYIMGSRHCGSTVLDLVLGSHRDIHSLGQVADLYRHFEQPEICTCGKALDSCPFWGRLLDGLTSSDREAIRTVGPLIAKERGLTRFLASRRLCERYVAPFDHLANLATRESAAEILVDSSKNATRAVALLRTSAYEVNVLHLVRDSRGMINSHNRRRDREAHLLPMMEWTAKNAIGSTLVRQLAKNRYRPFSFEEFMINPLKTLDSLSDWLQIDLSEVQASIASGDRIQMPHIFRGNRQLRERMVVSLDRNRLASQRMSEREQRRFWWSGGFVSRLWGYDRQQSYLDESTDIDEPTTGG